MGMSHLTVFDLDTLHMIADETREHVAHHGADVTKALDVNDAFSDYARPESELLRAIVVKGVALAAERTGVSVESGRGTVTLAMGAETCPRFFRVLKARKSKEGRYQVPANKSSGWGVGSMLPVAEHWVFGYHMDEESGTLGDLFAAEVTGSAPGLPGSLSLSDVVLLGSSPMSPAGAFEGDDEDTLPGLDDMFRRSDDESA